MRNTATVALLLAVINLSGCSPGADGSSQTDQALKELRHLVEQAKEQVPSDPVEWAKEDLKRIGDWEYRIVSVGDAEDADLVASLNELGQERWEVFWVDRSNKGLRLFLKRPAISYLTKVPISGISNVIAGGNDE